ATFGQKSGARSNQISNWSNSMQPNSRAIRRAAILALCLSALFAGRVSAQDRPSARELPRPQEMTGITPEVLVRTVVPGVPGKIAMATRVTYQPGARIRKHYHTSQIIFYILEGAMVVQDEGKDPVTLNPSDSLLIKPGTVHTH